MEESDENLVILLDVDPQRGYTVLVDQYLGFVYKVAHSKLFGICSKEDIEEFVSDIFYEFYCNRNKINLEKGSVKALLAVFTKRRAINLFHKKTKGDKDISLYDDNLQNLLIDKENVEDQILGSEARMQLIEAVKGLGYPDCEILIRKHYLGQTMREISVDLDLKRKTVEKRYERALKKLRKVIGGRENE
ncbi:sigma-70 family RNA polymerase sigma factor [Sinanaerobacter sp. ZZT-01]|uniref:sigma-70 family RNA polymerase sigma factor n=1 Tax=Sinanaerobacter sp. ZZT-01 TaxID=3111540 RepID=UPI002D78DB45|nr:sigma-70 family RNA polymerase sigma factor [Sinanaerobacter sp. ZZT-01]WRR93680.1 sigma-70 family RNA polymerase sigma factor [Sinanaerobacter sp. ZZT-01]